MHQMLSVDYCSGYCICAVMKVCTASLKTSWTTVMHLLPLWGHQYRLDSIYRSFNMLLVRLKKNRSFGSSFMSPDGE